MSTFGGTATEVVAGVVSSATVFAVDSASACSIVLCLIFHSRSATKNKSNRKINK